MRDKYFRKQKPLTILDATKSKMVKKRAQMPLINPYEAFNKVSTKRASVATDAKAIREMLPEVKLVENLLIDSILSPNDLTSVEPRWRLENSRFSNSSVVSKVLDVIKDHFVNSHKIKPRLKRYLKNVLFNYGSQTIVILPESSIDHLINKNVEPGVGIESYKNDTLSRLSEIKNNLGFLGKGIDFDKPLTEQNKTDIGLESMFKHHSTYSTEARKNKLSYSVHDNPSLLKLPALKDKIRRTLEQDRLTKIGVESFGTSIGYRSALNGAYSGGSSSSNISILTSSERAKIEGMYKDKGHQYSEMEKIEPQSRLERESVGHPIQYEPSAEAVIPITVPGTPDEKIGIIILLGEDGNPISMDTEINRWNTLASNYEAKLDQDGSDSDTQASSIIRNSYTKIYGQTSKTDKVTISQLKEFYSQMVIDDLNQRMVDGIYGQTVTIAAHEDIFKVMMARHLSNMGTRLLYIPASLMTYIAFDYNEDGTGRSLTEDVKIIASYRSMVMMATVLAQIKSSINHTKLRIKLDEDDMEPDDSVRQALQEYANFQAAMPFGNTSYHQQYGYFQQAGVSVEVDGNENYIDMKVDTDVTQRRYEAPDNDLNERLRKDFLSAYGVTTEHLDQILTSDTAAAVKAATVNFTKSVQNYRHTFNHFMTDYSRKYIANSQPLRKQIEEIILEHKDELPPEFKDYFKDNNNNLPLAINDLIRELIFELPDEAVNLSNARIESFESFGRFADEWIKVNIPETIINDLGVNLGDSSNDVIRTLQTVAKATLMRQFLQDNGIGSQFDELIFGTEDESTLDKVAGNHIGAISNVLVNMAKKLQEIREETKLEAEKQGIDIKNDEFGSGSSSNSDSFGSSDSSIGDSFGDTSEDEYSLDMDSSTIEETEESETTEEESEDTSETESETTAEDEPKEKDSDLDEFGF